MLPLHRWIVALTLASQLFPAPAAARSLEAPRAGMLLIARDQMRDPRFQQSVILVVRHDTRGTAGLILNRPLGPLPEPVRQNLPAAVQQVFWGGPVAALTVTGLVAEPCADSQELAPGLHLLRSGSLNELLHDAELPCPSLRLYLGHAGWAPKQLARELERGDWHLLPARPELVFEQAPGILWEALVPVREAPWI